MSISLEDIRNPELGYDLCEQIEWVRTRYGEGALAAAVLTALTAPRIYIPTTQPFNVVHVSLERDAAVETVVAWMVDEAGSLQPAVMGEFGRMCGTAQCTTTLLHDVKADVFYDNRGDSFDSLSMARRHVLGRMSAA